MKKTTSSAAGFLIRTCEETQSMASLMARAEMAASNLRAARCQLRVSVFQTKELRVQTREQMRRLRHAGMRHWVLMAEIKRNSLLGEELFCEGAWPETTANRRAGVLMVQ